MSEAVATEGASAATVDPWADAPLLPPTAHPRPDGDGWRLIDYAWEAGVAKLIYRRLGSGEKRHVKHQQPAHPGHEGWTALPLAARRARAAASAEAARWPARRPERGRA